MKTVLDQLADFIEESRDRLTCNQWISDDDMKVYIRKGRHMLYPGRSSLTLDIASVEVQEEKRGKGLWTAFLGKAHEMNPREATYIECVHNPILQASLIKHGWPSVWDSENLLESFFLLKEK